MTAPKMVDYFKIVSPKVGTTAMPDSQNIGDEGSYANYSWYQRLVQGAASRISRYREYDMMDNDVEIARSLDTIAEEMIGNDPNTDMPIELVVDSEKEHQVASSMVMTLKTALRYWNDLHDWDTRLFKLARNTIKYGDCFFIRRSDTSKWEFVHPKNVEAAIVNDTDMTQVLGWQIKRETKTPNSYSQGGGFAGNQSSSDNVQTFSAGDVVWFSLNDDLSESAPFGESVLRAVYRAQKQKELLEDAIIIYRIQRAPERRVFYIDVGKMPPQRVKTYLEGIKNEIRQRKVPTSGGGVDQVDAVYNPQSMGEDFFFAQRPDGKGSRVETLPGGQGLGELADLEYFQWKVFRGLRIPLSYMREGQDGSATNDGRTGVAYIQELRFAMYVKRLQGYISSVLDKEFKRYLHAAGIRADHAVFYIKLKEPENFGIWRKQQLDTELLNTYSTAAQLPGMSVRFAQKEYAQMPDEKIITNFRMRCEELGLDPDGDYYGNMRAVYGPPPDESGMMGGGMGGGMVAGSLPPMGGMAGGDMGMGGDPNAMGGPESGNGAPPQTGMNSGAQPGPQQ